MSEDQAIELCFSQDRDTTSEAARACSRALKLSTGRPYLDLAIGVLAGVIIVFICSVIVRIVYNALNIDYKDGGAFVALALTLVAVYAYYTKKLKRNFDTRYNSSIYDGEAILHLSSSGIYLKHQLMDWKLAWLAIDEVVRFKNGLGLRLGSIVIPVPYRAIPADLGIEGFCDQLEEWRKAAQ